MLKQQWTAKLFGAIPLPRSHSSLIFMMTVSSASISHLARSYLVGFSQPSAVTALHMNSKNPQNRWV